MIGWLIAAGIVGAAIGSKTNSSTNNYIVTQDRKRDYGSGIPYSHRRCSVCGNANSSAYVQGGNSSFVKLKFVCRDCGRVWTKTYRYR